ncbi:sensor histidine kinase [Streptomyces sp. H27-D2]|uniref:sensor histidine kinase n=1 Tax=Streptomyces sp. H27-D2 TaxID=3046304 RepID=UPI002DBFF86D|nr:histidine kinase [Streptomyces sp. H27-D2]MEC4017644.1 histidine kinase [Streptomyces sp. H27-D2]
MSGRFANAEEIFPEEATGEAPGGRFSPPPEPRLSGAWDALPDHAIPAPRLAWAITTVVICSFAVIALLNVLSAAATSAKIELCLFCVVTIFVVQFLHCSPRARQWPMRRKVITLGIQTILTYLPFLAFGITWGSMAGPLAGSILLMVRSNWAWALFALVEASLIAYSLFLGLGVISLIYIPVTTAMTGLVIYGLTRLTDLVHEVHATRGEMARMAVTQERMRFARDLHDLLGYSLSAITLKCELTYRLVATRPDRAREEVAEILDVSRQALSDVRLVASGYRDMSLQEEAESACSILTAADIRATVVISCGRLHPVIDTVLATALREGITNILRHSKVQVCTITATVGAETVRLCLVNDGVAEQPRAPAPHSGSGIGNLHTRLDAVGGRVQTRIRDDGRFQLTVEAPLRPASTAVQQDETAARPAA